MKKIPTTCTLDGDIIAWKTAFIADSEGTHFIAPLLESLIKKWTPKKCKKVEIALSCKARDNFRKLEYPGYKENRKEAYKPDCLKETFDVIKDSYDTLLWDCLEADDILGIRSSSGASVSVSIDKDLKGVPGWHWNPDKDKAPYEITPLQAEKWFCLQWMTGDSTDGIPGLWRVGPKKAEKILTQTSEDEWYERIVDLYKTGENVPKNTHDVKDMCIAMGRCVRILQNTNYDVNKQEIKALWHPIDGL
jgi:DNA polymerase-1